MDLFAHQADKEKLNHGPLAFRMRPQGLDEVVGQYHLLGPGAPLRRMIEEDRLHSFILYGPPGSGKTTIASLIAQKTKSTFINMSAVSAGSSEIRQVARDAGTRLAYHGQRTILFLDEIHRFNKAQQDVLLPIVEDGTLVLIGATTENPLYEINSALLSRLRIYVLRPLEESDLVALLVRALTDQARGLGLPREALSDEAARLIVRAAKGDARAALTILEAASTVNQGAAGEAISEEAVQQVTGKIAIYYDKNGDRHYDTVSAFIKSIRGSDPDAAVFWLAMMLEAGEDPMFIARRLVVHAAEDIGLADPMALVVAQAAAGSVALVGMPEARIPLAEATIYLACAPKSNSSKVAIEEAMARAREASRIEVPRHLADTSHPRAQKLLGHGKGYRYPHDYGGYVKQSYLPPEIQGTRFYVPGTNGKEKHIGHWLEELKSFVESMKIDD